MNPWRDARLHDKAAREALARASADKPLGTLMPPAFATGPIRAVMIGFSTRSDNLGVGALTASHVEILRDIARAIDRPIEITVVDNRNPRSPYVAGPDIRIVDLDTRFLLDPRGFFATVRRADLVIDIGAGDSFADIYGAARLRRMFAMKFLTHLAGTPLVLAPQTIGPFTKGWSKRLALASIKRSAIVATRDALSTQALRELGYDGAVVEASDVALRLPYDPPPPRAAGSPPRVGINVSGLLMNGGYMRKNEFGIAIYYPHLINDLIGFFQTNGAEVHLVAHVLHENGVSPSGRREIEDDYGAARDIVNDNPDVLLAPPFSNPPAAKSYIASLDFFMGARMHACIAAFSAGVAVVPMAYSRKFAGLFGSLGYVHTVDCTAEDHESILGKTREAWRNRTHLSGEVRRACQGGQSRLDLYVKRLHIILADIIRRQN